MSQRRVFGCIQCRIAVLGYKVHFMFLWKTKTYYSYINFPHGNHSQPVLVARVAGGWTETLLQSAEPLAVQKQKTKKKSHLSVKPSQTVIGLSLACNPLWLHFTFL